MHPPDDTTWFFAAARAPHIPEGHADDRRGEARKHSLGTDSEQACPQAIQAMAWWPRTCH